MLYTDGIKLSSSNHHPAFRGVSTPKQPHSLAGELPDGASALPLSRLLRRPFLAGLILASRTFSKI